MTTNCDLVLRWEATPEQLATLGTALWQWCTRQGGADIYPHLDNQPLADLIAGRHPNPGQTPRGGPAPVSHFRFRGQPSHDRQATIACLRRDLPAGGVEDVLVDGKSWGLSD
jgi:hypothetical protein